MFYLIIFIFGACVGSFLNCIIYRLETSQTFLQGRSFCPNCRHKLGFFDLIPILSFIFLKGKCRYCQKKISLLYPLVEIATGIIFVLIFNFFTPLDNFISNGASFSIFNFQTIINLCYLLIISCLLIIIFIYDLKHYIIPDKVIYPTIAIVFIYRIFEGLKMSLIVALLAGGFFFLLWLASQGKWMGLGDAKLAFLIGLFLGSANILVAMFSAFLIGAIIGLGLIMLGKKTLKSQVPFGPFLIIGTFIALFFGDKIISWYL